MKKKIFVVAAIMISSQLFAQLETDSIVLPGTEFPWSMMELNRVIVTATKYPRKQSETGKVVTVITRSQLERSSGKTLGEVLNSVVGTTIIGANNNPGTNQTVSIRGSSAGNVLILVDGVPANDPSTITNYFDLNFFAIDQVERIEILKGGQSTLYGSDAVAGVINIITRKNNKKAFGANTGLAGGSYQTFKEYTGFYGNTKKIGWSAQYTHLASDGFSAAYDSTGKKNFDKDGFNQHAVNTGLNFKLSRKVQARFFGNYSYYRTDLDAAAYTDEKDFDVKNDNIQTGLGLVYTHLKGALQFNYVFNYVNRDYWDDSIFKSSPYVDYSKSQYIGRTHFVELFSNWALDNVDLLTGVDYRLNNTNQDYFSSGPFGPFAPPVLRAKMSQFSPYASVIFKNGEGLNIELGGRWNLHSEYGSNFSYTINPSYTINGRVKVFANLYSSFKTPTLYQLFDLFAGNPGLKPEKAMVAEAGLAYNTLQIWLRAVGFYRKTKNSIQYIIIDPTSFQSQYRNVSSQENYGLEFEAGYKPGKWDLSANYTYSDGKTRSPYDGTGFPLSKDTSYYNLYRIPKNSFNLSVGCYAMKDFFVSCHFRYTGKRFEAVYASEPIELKTYYTIDVYGEYRLQTKWKLFLDLKNITDQKYFDIPGYNSKRFNFMAGVNFSL